MKSMQIVERSRRLLYLYTANVTESRRATFSLTLVYEELLETSLSSHFSTIIIIIIIIINSYILMTLIKLTHEKLYAIYIKWIKLSEIENYLLFIRLLYAVETIIMRLCIKLVHVDCTLKNEWLSHFKLL